MIKRFLYWWMQLIDSRMKYNWRWRMIDFNITNLYDVLHYTIFKIKTFVEDIGYNDDELESWSSQLKSFEWFSKISSQCHFKKMRIFHFWQYPKSRLSTMSPTKSFDLNNQMGIFVDYCRSIQFDLKWRVRWSLVLSLLYFGGWETAAS